MERLCAENSGGFPSAFPQGSFDGSMVSGCRRSRDTVTHDGVVAATHDDSCKSRAQEVGYVAGPGINETGGATECQMGTGYETSEKPWCRRLRQVQVPSQVTG